MKHKTETEPNLNYLSHFAKFLVQQKCTLKIVQPVLEYDGDNFVIDRKKLRIIEPVP